MKYIFFISVLFLIRISQTVLSLVAFVRLTWQTANAMYIFNRVHSRCKKVNGFVGGEYKNITWPGFYFEIFLTASNLLELQLNEDTPLSPGPVYMSAHSSEFTQFEVRMLFIGPWCTWVHLCIFEKSWERGLQGAQNKKVWFAIFQKIEFCETAPNLHGVVVFEAI